MNCLCLRTPFAILLLLTSVSFPVAVAAEKERILVTNTLLISRDAPVNDVRVNLLIVDGKLLVVSRDELAIEPGDVAVDAGTGFLLGELIPGESPTFLILGKDPREDFDVLLNTAPHVRFAIRDGAIVKNELPMRRPSTPEAGEQPSRWTAYTPPPVAVPIRYFDSRKWNRFSTRPVSGLFVDTGSLIADGLMTYSLETYWRSGPYMLGFEYLGTDIDAPESGNPFFSGYHATFSWAATGEMRPYRKRSGLFYPLPVNRPVNHGGWGTFETAIRYSHQDMTDGTVDGGVMDILSLGIDWWAARDAQFSVNYRYITLDRFGIQGTSSGVDVRLLLTLD